MRYLALLLLLLPLASAATLYSGDSYAHEGENFTFTLFHTDNSVVYVKVLQLNDAEEIEDNEEEIADLTEELEDAIAEAKLADKLQVQSGGSSTIVPYGGCGELAGQTVCFTGITYYEEDASPLGDNKLDSVQYVNGSFRLPFTVTFEKPVSALTAIRSFSASTIYPHDRVTVTLTLTNAGTASSGRVTLEDHSPVRIASGTTRLEVGSLSAAEVKQAVYVIEPQEPGTFTFSAFADGVSLEDKTITVLPALQLNGSTDARFSNEPATISFNVTNTYREDIDFTSFTIAATTPIPSCNVTSTPRGTHERVFELELAVGESVAISCAVQPAAGEHEAVLAVRSAATEELRYELPFTLERRGLKVSPTVTDRTVSLVFNNTLLERLEGITVDYGDGTEKSLFLQAESSLTLTHTYSVEQATITVTANGESREYPVTLSGVVVEETHEVEAPTETPVEIPAEAPAEALPPAGATGVPETAEPIRDDRNVIEKLLDWLENLFH